MIQLLPSLAFVLAATSPALPQQGLRVEATAETVRHLQATGESVRTVLHNLFRQAELNYTIAPDVTGNFTGEIRDVPFETALQIILRTMNATYGRQAGVYMVTANPGLISDPISMVGSYDSGRGSSLALTSDGDFLYMLRGEELLKIDKKSLKIVSRVPLEMEVDVRQALQELCKEEGIECEIAPGVTGLVKIRMVAGRTFTERLHDIMRQAKVTYVNDKGVFRFTPESGG